MYQLGNGFYIFIVQRPRSVETPIIKTDQSLSEFIYASTKRHLHQQTQCSITQ